MGSVPALLRALVDDAGLFPPAQLAMPDAVARHRADTRAGHGMLTGRFLCPASRLPELRNRVGEGPPIRAGLIGDQGVDALMTAAASAALDSRVVVEAVETPIPAGDDPATGTKEALDAAAVARLPASVALYVEPGLGPGWDGAVAALGDWAAAARGGAKVRCGGGRADLFPAPAALAAFVHTCVRLQVPFKATAGLHHAVRHRDPRTGFVHHGYLNLLLAVGRAVAGAPAGELAAVLEETDGEAMAREALELSPEVAAGARALFVGYGSCSTAEPIADAAALGLLAGRDG